MILSAIYMLWMFRRVIFGPLTNPENQKLKDLNGREILILAPVMALIIFMGVYPQPFLSRMKPSIDLTLKRVFASQGTPDSHEQHCRRRELRTMDVNLLPLLPAAQVLLTALVVMLLDLFLKENEKGLLGLDRAFGPGALRSGNRASVGQSGRRLWRYSVAG